MIHDVFSFKTLTYLQHQIQSVKIKWEGALYMPAKWCAISASRARNSSKVIPNLLISPIEVLLIDINMVTEGKKFSTISTVQDLFNITDSNTYNIIYYSCEMPLLLSISIPITILKIDCWKCWWDGTIRLRQQ